MPIDAYIDLFLDFGDRGSVCEPAIQMLLTLFRHVLEHRFVKCLFEEFCQTSSVIYTLH